MIREDFRLVLNELQSVAVQSTLNAGLLTEEKAQSLEAEAERIKRRAQEVREQGQLNDVLMLYALAEQADLPDMDLVEDYGYDPEGDALVLQLKSPSTPSGAAAGTSGDAPGGGPDSLAEGAESPPLVPSRARDSDPLPLEHEFVAIDG